MVVLSIMAVIWISLTYYNHKMQNQYNNILERYLLMNEVSSASQEMITALNNYLLEPSPDTLDVLYTDKDKIQKLKSDVSEFMNKENQFALTNYVNLVDSLTETTDRSLMFHTERETANAMKAFAEATRISNYISDMTLTLIDTELRTYDRFYRGIIDQSVELNKLGIWLFLLITLLLLLFAYWFSLRITKPVLKLSQAANELSKGRFDLKIEVDSNDEIAFLAKMFDRMRININNLISEIHYNAQLENELQQNKLLLQESQLRSLQSQINPHFLFNTLNTLSKKAYLEGSEETSDLLVSVAGLLRHNLRRLDKSITLAEEVRVLQQYINIQKARFTDRLHFQMEVEEACLDVQIPGLTLQPIVENAVIYAVEPEEDGGTVWFRVIDGIEQVTIEIEDNGPGMTNEKIKRILEEAPDETEGRSTGIGISNVVKRLRLFYNYDDVIHIESRIGHGTKVVLNIPKQKGVDTYDKTTNR